MFCVVVGSVFILSFASCSSKSVKPDTPPADAAPDNPVTSTDLQSSDTGNAKGLQTVHFEYDSSILSAEAKSVLKANAAILKNNPSLSIQIEGHCDQRGGIQYNLALGEKRANSAKHFLIDQGIPDGRITTISFGKEHPVDQAETEEAYAKNRRANFVITKSLG
jgi:peptidoglycan-associated lipoprotein